ATSRTAVPRGDAHLIQARVEHLEHLDLVRRPERIGLDVRVERNRRRLPEHLLPERVEVVGLAYFRSVALRDGFGHWSILSLAYPLAYPLIEPVVSPWTM